MDVIEEKVEAGGKEIEEKPRKAPKPTKMIDLVSVLQKSLEQTGGKKKATGQIARERKRTLQRKRREMNDEAESLMTGTSRNSATNKFALIHSEARHRSA